MYRHCQKERVKISKLAEFEGDMSETSEDTVPQSRKILQTFVWWEGGGGRGEVYKRL